MADFFRCPFLKSKIDPFLQQVGSNRVQMNPKNRIWECSHPPDKVCFKNICMNTTTFYIARNNNNELVFINRLNTYGEF